MSSPSSSPRELDEILARLFAELEHAADRELVVRRYCQQHPQYAEALREASELDQVLGVSAEEVEPPLPERLGSFRIVRRIAKGGMGVICEAIQEPLDRRVAVKIIRRGRTQPSHRQRFLREQRVLASLHQTHIVPVFASGEEGPVQYFAMPYIDGAALHHVVRATMEWERRLPRQKTPPLSQLVEMAAGSRGDRETGAWSEPAAKSSVAVMETPPDGELQGPPAECRSRKEKAFSLSQDYFRSVAQIMADVAESLHHAHQRGYVHRDLKPANIMVDPAGQSWVIDFGLAGYLKASPEPAAESEAAESGEALLRTQQAGTPGYWAPEQRRAGGVVDQRADVWGLGVTLYELLTLRPAFPIHADQDHAGSNGDLHPLPARRLVEGLPRDLAAICHKAIQVAPEDRYQTAREFAEDLRRWLRRELTTAHPRHEPARTARRAWLWARRSKGWASAIGVSVLALVILTQAQARYRADMAANEREYKTIEAANQRDSLTQKVQELFRPEHASGWSDKAWDLERQATQTLPDDGTVRDLAASTLIGLDARSVKRFEKFGGGRVLFDSGGKRLLMGSVCDVNGSPVEAKLWDSTTHRLQELPVHATGPLAFGPDGTPLQLFAREGKLVLASLVDPKVGTSMEFPEDSAILEPLQAAMLPDGTCVAAAMTTKDKKRMLAFWDGRSGKLLRTFLSEVPADKPESEGALAVSPDGTLLAEGDRAGTIRVWSITTGSAIATLKAGPSQIHCISLARDAYRRDWKEPRPEGDGWLLAAGDAGGTVTIWDLATKLPRSYCRGSYFDVYAVAFSPDGSTLASAGRHDQRLWDVATGRLLLRIRSGDSTTDLAFSPDGRSLAVCTPEAQVWELEYGRGVKTFRGLASQASIVAFSPDGRFVAALARDWQLGIWDLRDGHLLHLWDGPRGITSDNASMAFSPDGGQLALSAGREVRLWDVKSGKKIRSWGLGEGFVDVLAFPAADRLLSFHVETSDQNVGPYSNAPPSEYPRICRIRHLLDDTRKANPVEIKDFNWHVHTAVCSPDGKYFAVDGRGGPRGERRILKVFDATGRELLPVPTTCTAQYGLLAFDSTGTTLAALTDNAGRAMLLEMPSGRFLGELPHHPECMTARATFWGRRSYSADGEPRGLSLHGRDKDDEPSQGFSLHRRDREEPLVTFSTNSDVTTAPHAFDATGTLLAWGCGDGTVHVADRVKVQRRLEELGLGW